MNKWAIIPVKPADQAKLRLAGELSPQRREALVQLMQAYVFGVVAKAGHLAQVCLVGKPDAPTPEAWTILADPDQGLNAAVAAGLAEAIRHGAERAAIIFADLPQVTVNDIELLCLAPADTIAIAPDRHGTGTNALSLPLPAARHFTFAFGPDSFARHMAEAERLGLSVETIHSHGLSRDVDEPADLPDAAGLEP